MYYLMLCPCCGAKILLDQQEQGTAKSLLIDPHTGLPPDTDPYTGELAVATPEARARSRRRPLCSKCLATYEATGAFDFSVRLTGEHDAIVVADGIPLVDDKDRVMAVQCPDGSCGKVVNVVDGKLERHHVRGKKCGLSGIPVEFVD
ncbi:hypothetical protein ACFWPU_01195 [Streptomyces sp. NPDC058471]|uniref:hypothetical protein n=1 Tax=Streptomyces sp. NPDC058471 TaxID=3346516 RepID=UPI0036674761